MKWQSYALAAGVFAGLGASAPARSAPGTFAPLYSATDWLNGRITPADLAGHVVVVDIFTVDCSNCQNVVPALRSLYAKDRSRGLRVVGIHAPETPEERSRRYVEQSLARQGIVWPVAIDNDFALWRAYDANVWPTQLFFDRNGRLRKVVIGDSQDDAVRATVESLL